MIRKSLVIGTVLVLSACGGSGGGGGNADNGLLTGQFTDLGIEGVRYQTQSQSGLTDEDGRFQYYPGETVDFWVGNLQIGSAVPAAPYITLLDMTEASRAQLNAGGVNDQGLSDHRPVEDALTSDLYISNLTRLMLTLDDDRGASANSNIRFSERDIAQFNVQLEAIGGTLDLTVPNDEFANKTTLSPANQILKSICFFPEDDFRCGEPPTQAEIDAAPPRPQVAEDIDPDITYREDLIQRQRSIEDSKRTLDLTSLDRVRTYLLQQANAYNAKLGEPYFLSDFAVNIPAGDQAIRRLTVESFKGDVILDNLVVISTNPQAVTVHSSSAQLRTVEYYATGAAGTESTLLINFRLPGEYRWIRKSVRVRVI